MEMLMNPTTGSVAARDEWIAEYTAIVADVRGCGQEKGWTEDEINEEIAAQWGSETFDDSLVEVVENIEGKAGYDPQYGAWREVK